MWLALIELLTRRRAALSALLLEAQGIAPLGQGLTITLHIYITILEDAITTLDSLIHYLNQ